MPSSLASSAPSPAPSTASNPAGVKRKREYPRPALANQPIRQSVELVSQVHVATEYLKSKNGTELSLDAILKYLSIQYTEDSVKQTFQRALQSTAVKIRYNPRGLDGVGSYKYLPAIEGVTSVETLKAYLQSRSDSVGVKVEDIKDGWPDCLATIEAMEQRHELIVLRDKRKALKTVWQDDPTLHNKVCEDFQAAWNDIRIPANPDELRSALQKAGLNPTSAPRKIMQAQGPKRPKKRAQRKTGKITNTHLLDKLKDFSHKRA